MGLVDYNSRHPNQTKEFFVAKLEIIFASAKSLNLNSIQSAPRLHSLFKTSDPASQISVQNESGKNSKNTISRLVTQLRTPAFLLSPAKHNPLVKSSYNSNYSINAYPALQKPVSTPLAQQNPPHFLKFMQNKNVNIPAGRETKSFETNFQQNSRHSYHNCKSQTTNIIAGNIAQNGSRNQLHHVNSESNFDCIKKIISKSQLIPENKITAKKSTKET